MLLQIQKLEVPNTVGHDFAFSASYDKGRQLKHQPSLFETPKQPIQAMSPPKPTSKVMVYDQKFRAYMLNSSMNLCKIKSIGMTAVLNQLNLDTKSAPTAVVAFSVITYIVTLIFNGVNSAGGRFNVRKVSDNYRIRVTPPRFTFAIWGVIYTMVTVSLIEAAFAGSWSSVAHFIFAVSNVLNSLWIYVWCKGSRPAIVVATIITFLMALNLFGMWTALENCHSTGWMYYFHRNTFAIYLAWVVAATMVSIGIVLVRISKIIGDNAFVPIFFAVCPLIVVVASLHIYNTEGINGTKSSLGLWAALAWALWGASRSARGLNVYKDEEVTADEEMKPKSK